MASFPVDTSLWLKRRNQYCTASTIHLHRRLRNDSANRRARDIYPRRNRHDPSIHHLPQDPGSTRHGKKLPILSHHVPSCLCPGTLHITYILVLRKPSSNERLLGLDTYYYHPLPAGYSPYLHAACFDYFAQQLLSTPVRFGNYSQYWAGNIICFPNSWTVVSGWWYGYGLDRGVIGFSWWLIALVSVLGVVAAIFVYEGSGHEVFLPGEEDVDLEQH